MFCILFRGFSSWPIDRYVPLKKKSNFARRLQNSWIRITCERNASNENTFNEERKEKIKEDVDTETDFIGHPLRERSVECTLSNRTRNEVFINPYSIVNATHSLSLSFLILILSSRYRFHERANYEQANPRKIRHGNYKRIG